VGRAILLIMAINEGFKIVVGIEFAEELYRDSLLLVSNSLSNKKFKRCKIILDDATNYMINEKFNVFFFYNPFNEIVLIKVLQNLEKSLHNYNRKVYIIYFNPIHSKIILKYGYNISYKYESKEKVEILIFYK